MKKIKQTKKLLMTFIVALLHLQTLAFDGDLGAIIKRPGKNELFVSGEFKTVIVIDSKSGKTTRTLNLERGASKLAFSKDGKNLIAVDKSVLLLIDPETGKTIKSYDGSNLMVFENGNYIADINSLSKTVTLLSVNDLSVKMEYKCEFKPNFVGFDIQEKNCFIFSREDAITDEQSLIKTQVQKSEAFNIFNNTYQKEQADEKGVKYIIVSISNQKASEEITLPYSPEKGYFGHEFNQYKNKIYLLSYSSFYKLENKNKITPLEYNESGYSFATATSENGRYVVQTGSKKGFIYDCETDKFIPYLLSKSFGLPTASSLSFNSDTLYLLSKDFTVDIFNLKGELISQFTISGLENKLQFAVFYYNGFSKKEARDKEAAILNKNMTEIKLPEINLEESINRSDVLLAKFSSVKEAADFQSRLNKQGLQYKTTIIPISN